MKITMQEFEEFEKKFLFEKIKNPYYRLGQAFINTYPNIVRDLEVYRLGMPLWECDDRAKVLELLSGCIEL